MYLLRVETNDLLHLIQTQVQMVLVLLATVLGPKGCCEPSLYAAEKASAQAIEWLCQNAMPVPALQSILLSLKTLSFVPAHGGFKAIKYIFRSTVAQFIVTV